MSFDSFLSKNLKKTDRRSFIKLAGTALASLIIPGCASTTQPYSSTYTRPISPSQPIYTPQAFPSTAHRHVMAQGETVWRVAKMYGASVDDIVRLNRIADVRDISIGTSIILPESVHEPMPAYHFDDVPLAPNTGKWKYIIIHHTASDIGDVNSIDRYHKSRGYHSLGYHFLVGNGSKQGQRVGLIEPGPRWYAQQDGAHCRADNMNTKGIGVCVVGNYSNDYVKDEQLRPMAFLTRKLMLQYNIPKDRVLGHRDVRGAATECPGNLFPWVQFKAML